MSKKRQYPTLVPMRIQALKGSRAERAYYTKSALPGGAWPMPKAIATDIDPSPLDDLIFHGGKVVPQMEFQNIFLGSGADWNAADIEKIDGAIDRAMKNKSLNNVMVQYFPGAKVTCDQRPFIVLNDPRPLTLDEAGVQAKVISLLQSNRLRATDLGTTLFNLVLPPGTTLKLDGSSSLHGLGGYHGSVKTMLKGREVTVYYSANVFSQQLPNGRQNGILAFDQPWKNVVGTLYHEINEFRTDPDVNDAIATDKNDFLGWTSRQGHECGDQPIFVAKSLSSVFKEVLAKGQKTPVQFMFSNAVHGAEGPIRSPH
jgi:hypothetical protein